MNQPASLYSKTSSNATCCGNIYLSTSTGNDPRQGWRTPLNNITYSEQRDEETGYGYFGARYMDHELMTMWLSVDPMSDKYPNISSYAYCNWNPIKLVDPDGREFMDNEDWYKNGEGDVQWDENVKGQDDLPDNYTYLGSEGVGVNEDGQVTRVARSPCCG